MTEKYLETIGLIRLHSGLYPLMEPRDAVKLLYQSEFGCGHFVPDEERARAYLRAEWRSTPRDPGGRAFDELGGGFIRVHLAPITDEDVLEALLSAFIRSARPCGSMEGFSERLEALRSAAREGVTPFASDALEAFLADYLALGCPAVHHTEAFRSAYAPAYRVVLNELMRR